MKQALTAITLSFAMFGPLVSSAALANNESQRIQEKASRSIIPTTDFAAYVHEIKQEVNERGVPGAALAIVSGDKILHLETWGVRDVDKPAAVNSETIFRIASMSKTFGGTAAAMLVNHGLIDWDTRIHELFPHLRMGTGSSSHQITFGQVVSQSTGLMPHSYSNMLDGGVGYDQIKEKFPEIPTVCKPGQCYGYQNVVFSLISDAVEVTTGTSYEQFVELNLFDPLGMSTASIGLEAFKSAENVTAPHRKSRSSWRRTSTNPAYYSVAPAAGVNASILDMTLWIQAHLGAFPEVLSDDLLTMTHSPAVKSSYGSYFNRWQGLEQAYYARGWRVFDYKGVRAVHHGGGVRGYRSEMAFVPEANVGVILLLNGESNVANDIVPAFIDRLALPN